MEDKKEVVDDKTKEIKKIEEPKKKNSVGVIVLLAILMVGSLIGGYFINQAGLLNFSKEVKIDKKEKKKETKEVVKEITYEEMDTMEKISESVFIVEKESLKTSDLTDEQKLSVTQKILGKKYNSGYTETTGTEMTNIFKKYFGKDQTLKFIGIKCGSDHGSEEENQMLIFDEAQDKYIWNPKHPGHGGGGYFYGYKMGFDSVKEENGVYKYNVKILFYGKGHSGDTGGTSYGNGYKSYKDCIDGKNMIVQIDNNPTYTTYMDGLPIVDIDTLYKDNRDKLDTYTFNFVKEGDNLVFKDYEKK